MSEYVQFNTNVGIKQVYLVGIKQVYLTSMQAAKISPIYLNWAVLERFMVGKHSVSEEGRLWSDRLGLFLSLLLAYVIQERFFSRTQK